MIGKASFKILSILSTIIFMGTVINDCINRLRQGGSLDGSFPLAIDRGPGSRKSSIGKLSMLYGETNALYERALAAHLPHNENFGYPMYVLREKTLPGYWSKPAYILDQLLAELALPEEQRLKWLAWFDGDIVLMNPKIPLEIFLPPENWSHVHALVTNDHRGLNNGVFFLRVHEWSVWLMTACLGTEIFDSDLELEFGDQTALGMWLKKERFRNNTIHMPQRWFNAYAGHRGETNGLFSDPFSPQNKVKANSIKEGDLLVHHAGHKSLRAQRMAPWMDVAEQHLPQWELDLDDTTYEQEIRDFWLEEAPKERKNFDRQIKKEAQKEKEKADLKAGLLSAKPSEPKQPPAQKETPKEQTQPLAEKNPSKPQAQPPVQKNAPKQQNQTSTPKDPQKDIKPLSTTPQLSVPTTIDEKTQQGKSSKGQPAQDVKKPLPDDTKQLDVKGEVAKPKEPELKMASSR